ncbi:hypothetical protein N7455_009674 [Penicillium solitum]|uniref:uncharacterized protein n=1 Tax=Penicillium solitum TaxID=60172 RepID=UPI0017A3F5AF|nr:hypothetical protein HAV15_001806 [Penicillium sp. str. \
MVKVGRNQCITRSQCTWNEGAEENIVTILANSATNTDESTPTSSSSSDSSESSGGSSLSTGAIIGIAIGAVAAVVLIAVAAFFFLRRRKQDAASEPEQSILQSPAPQSISEFDSKQADGNVFAMPPIMHGELSGNDTQIYQLHADSGSHEIYELPGRGIPQPAELSERDAESPGASEMSLVSPDASLPSPDVSRSSTQRLYNGLGSYEDQNRQ